MRGNSRNIARSRRRLSKRERVSQRSRIGGRERAGKEINRELFIQVYIWSYL